MTKRLLLLFTLVCSTLIASAQDKHFTQFYAAPLNLNPALTGTFDGTFRVAAIYRDQWRGSLESPFKTFAAELDYRFNVSDKGMYEDKFGVGILFYTDRVGVTDFHTNQMTLYGAYHKALDTNNSQSVSIGFQLGVGQRNINYEDIYFNDQFNGTTGYELPSAEDLPKNNFTFLDLGTGIYYLYKPTDDFSLHIGGAIHHFNRPVISFYGDNDVKLFMKYSAHLGAKIATSERLQIFPRLHFAKQGPHLETNAGVNFRMGMNDYSGSAVHFGTWARPVAYDENSFGLDAIVLLAGYEFKNVLFGLSYDINVNALQTYKRGQGAFEISIAYLGEYENESILCPMF